MITRKAADALLWRQQHRGPLSKIMMQRRFDCHKSEEAVARIVGVSVERYILWESGRAAPPQEYIRRIASALRIGPALLGPKLRRRAIDSIFIPRRGRR